MLSFIKGLIHIIMQKKKKNALSYCGLLIKDNEADKFLLSMLLPARIRDDVWAVLAFNHEISKTREVVSDSALGHIRLQWWRDAIKGIYETNTVLEHEVVKPLAHAIHTHDLPRDLFDALIYAREFDLEDVLPAHIDGLLHYADYTTTPLLRLVAHINGHNISADDIRPVAINFALSGLLRSIPFHAASQRCYLPENLLKKHAITREDITIEKNNSVICDIVEEITKARLPLKKQHDAFLKGCQALSHIYFAQIKSERHNIFSSRMQMPPPFKILRLFWKTKIMHS